MHRSRRPLVALTALALAGGATLAAAPAASASSRHHGHQLGTRSLAEVLAKDGQAFDRNQWDYDVLDAAVGAVLAAKPDSPVKLLADGTVALTAFLPNDRAFRSLVRDLTGTSYRSEADVFAAAATLGIDTIENVLLYHVVPGATITSKQAVRSNGAQLATALPDASITVKVRSRCFKIVQLVDADTDDANPYLVPGQLDINKGNRQIAHGISLVLRPVDL
ncbi:fasciclin domain-containing protein [Angustibacter aerolatus]